MTKKKLIKREDIYCGDIHIAVTYEYEKSPPQWEECHGQMVDVGGLVYVELLSVDLILASRINILPFLTEHDKRKIINNLDL